MDNKLTDNQKYALTQARQILESAFDDFIIVYTSDNKEGSLTSYEGKRLSMINAKIINLLHDLWCSKHINL